MHDPVTWYKITYTGEQVAQWVFQNNAPVFVLEVPLRDLLTSICNFVPYDWVVQRAYYSPPDIKIKIATLKSENTNYFTLKRAVYAVAELARHLGTNGRCEISFGHEYDKGHPRKTPAFN